MDASCVHAQRVSYDTRSLRLHARVTFHFGSDQPGSVIRGGCVFFRILSNPKAVKYVLGCFSVVLVPDFGAKMTFFGASGDHFWAITCPPPLTILLTPPILLMGELRAFGQIWRLFRASNDFLSVFCFGSFP